MWLNIFEVNGLGGRLVVHEQLLQVCLRGTLCLCLTQFLGPRPTWMQRIPPSDFSGVTATPWIMVAESVDTDVPKRQIVLDQEAFGHCDPQQDSGTESRQ